MSTTDIPELFVVIARNKSTGKFKEIDIGNIVGVDGGVTFYEDS